MGDQEKGINAENSDEAAKGTTDGAGHSLGRRHAVWQSIANQLKQIPNLSGPARLVLIIAASIFGAVLLLWILDKVVFFYVAQTYVEEVARVLDLNRYLANALVILTFVVAAFFARYLWSFSKQRRLVGIIGLTTLLVGHSLVLWYGTRNNAFDISGNATKCYVLTRDGQVIYREQVGIDPSTGRECRPVTPEMYERLQKYASGKRPNLITDPNPTFFDPRSGEPIVWYYKGKDQTIEVYDLMGFQPDTGDELLPVTKDIVSEWRKQEGDRTRRGPQLIQQPEKYVFFDPRNGTARAWYWTSADGRYEFYDGPGFQSQTGDQLKIVTREIVDDWKRKQSNPTIPNRQANKVEITKDTVFFDPVTGQARLWYWRRDKADYDFFDGPGFHPQNGQTLQSFTKDVLVQYQKEIDQKIADTNHTIETIKTEGTSTGDNGPPRNSSNPPNDNSQLGEAARRCDDLAANPSDAHRMGQGVSYADLKPQAAAAVEACELAAKQNPNEPRFQYQLGRALELTGDGSVRAKNRQRALEIHQSLVRVGYAAAFDNLASLYRWDKKDLATAVALFRKGVQLGDSDSMVSLADLIESNQVIPAGPNETPQQLYKQAAELGNPNAIRAYHDEQENAEKTRQQQVQQLQQQQMMLQFLGTVLRNIH